MHLLILYVLHTDEHLKITLVFFCHLCSSWTDLNNSMCVIDGRMAEELVLKELSLMQHCVSMMKMEKFIGSLKSGSSHKAFQKDPNLAIKIAHPYTLY